MDRCWHRLKFSGASGHICTMNAGFVVMMLIIMMMLITVMVMVMLITMMAVIIRMKTSTNYAPGNQSQKWNPKGKGVGGASLI